LRTLNIKRKWVLEKDELVHLFQIRSVSAFFFRNFFGNALKKDRCQQSAVIISQIKLILTLEAHKLAISLVLTRELNMS
jgi:hypothetical protein